MRFLVFDDCLQQITVYFALWVIVLVISVVGILFYPLKSRSNFTKFVQLHDAISKGDAITSIRIIQRYPKFVNVVLNSDGYTPFLRACFYGNTQLVKVMLNCGADVNIKSKNEESAVYLTVYYMIKNPNLKDASCLHALYYAGADINTPSLNNFTPLQFAAAYGHTQLVVWLISKGANIHVHPHPYLLARFQGHYDTAIVLKKLAPTPVPAIES